MVSLLNNNRDSVFLQEEIERQRMAKMPLAGSKSVSRDGHFIVNFSKKLH